MQEQTWQHNQGRGRSKTASLLGMALGVMTSMALPVRAKTHDIQMTAGGEGYRRLTAAGRSMPLGHSMGSFQVPSCG